LINASWSNVIKMFPENAVDTVMLVDVIEHVEKKEALGLLDQTASIARKQVAIFTPLGFMPMSYENQRHSWGLGGDLWQKHKSGWSPEDFGSDWDIFAAKIFHTHDHSGRKLEQPYGAFWAIKNKPFVPSERLRKKDLQKEKLRSLTNRLIDNSPQSANFLMHKVLKLSQKILRF
jgi:hypothetical protein